MSRDEKLLWPKSAKVRMALFFIPGIPGMLAFLFSGLALVFSPFTESFDVYVFPEFLYCLSGIIFGGFCLLLGTGRVFMPGYLLIFMAFPLGFPLIMLLFQAAGLGEDKGAFSVAAAGIFAMLVTRGVLKYYRGNDGENPDR